VGGDSPEVDAANARNRGLSVESSGAWECRDDLKRLFEFLREYVGVISIDHPPGLLSPNVFLRSSCEANAAISSTRPKFAKDHLRIDETTGFDVFVGIY
jgi:hypothetical protein